MEEQDECQRCDGLGWLWEYGIEEQWKVPCQCKDGDRWAIQEHSFPFPPPIPKEPAA